MNSLWLNKSDFKYFFPLKGKLGLILRLYLQRNGFCLIRRVFLLKIQGLDCIIKEKWKI